MGSQNARGSGVDVNGWMGMGFAPRGDIDENCGEKITSGKSKKCQQSYVLRDYGIVFMRWCLKCAAAMVTLPRRHIQWMMRMKVHSFWTPSAAHTNDDFAFLSTERNEFNRIENEKMLRTTINKEEKKRKKENAKRHNDIRTLQHTPLPRVPRIE